MGPRHVASGWSVWPQRTRERMQPPLRAYLVVWNPQDAVCLLEGISLRRVVAIVALLSVFVGAFPNVELFSG